MQVIIAFRILVMLVGIIIIFFQDWENLDAIGSEMLIWATVECSILIAWMRHIIIKAKQIEQNHIDLIYHVIYQL